MIGYFTFGYLIINWISRGRSFFYDVSIGIDSQIPFIPVFILGYILVYLSVVFVYIAIKDRTDWLRAVVSFLLATTLAYIIFLLFPVKMNMRPELSQLSGTYIAITRVYYFIDLPYNCFPSLHVTYPLLATFVSFRNHHIMRWVFLAMTIIVAISVIIVKQHYIADVIGGILNASLCFWLTVKTEKIWMKWFTPSNVLRS